MDEFEQKNMLKCHSPTVMGLVRSIYKGESIELTLKNPGFRVIGEYLSQINSKLRVN